MYGVELYEQKQHGQDEAVALSPGEKIGGSPAAPPPGVERAEANEIKREKNPNAE